MVGGLLVVVAVLPACSGSGESNAGGSGKSTHSVDVGLPDKVTVKGDKLSVALLVPGEGNTYGALMASEGKKKAAALGIDIAVFDAGFDPQKQFNQAQTALSTGKYNAIATLALDGQLMCSLLTQDAPKAGVLVSIMGEPICGKAQNPPGKLWSPGTVSQIGVEGALPGYQALMTTCAKQVPGPQKVAVVNGVAGEAATESLSKAVKDYVSASGSSLEADVSTPYTTEDALKTTQNLLQAHPETTLIVTDYSGQTTGVVQALKQAGKQPGDVSICESSGLTQQGVRDMQAGYIKASLPQFPNWGIDLALESLKDAFDGKTPIVRVVNGNHPQAPVAYSGVPTVVTPDTAKDFPAYNG